MYNGIYALYNREVGSVNTMVYLDNSSTTMPCERAVSYINKALTECWGNPSSLHVLGMEAELALINARETVARTLNADTDSIFFTGSGTEANNTALMSALKSKKRGGRVIITSIEHPSVLQCGERLEAEGLEVVYIKPDKSGKIPLSALENALDSNTVLVSMMLVNNETGAIQPVKEAAGLVKRTVPSALFHCDAVQGYGKLPINVKHLGIDLLSASGHKIHGPKGIGFLYRKKGVHIPPLIIGGGQEKGMRSGTEPLPLIMGLTGAIEELPKLENQLKKQEELCKYARELFSVNPNIVINSPDDALPYILNISLPGYRSETLLHFLESENIFVSSGSACAKGKGSYVLNEMGLSTERTDSALRLSFSRYNTNEDIELFYNALCRAQGKLRKVK